jgi:hypothetical protein
MQPEGPGSRVPSRFTSQRAEVAPPAITAESVDLDMMALVLELMLVGNDGQHALETLVLELDHRTAAKADEMLVMGLLRHRLIPLEALAEIVRPDQSAPH